MWDNKGAVRKCANTNGPLTTHLFRPGRGLAMQATPTERARRPSPHPIPDRVAHRALTRCELDPDTGCFISNYSVASHGYAQIGWQLEDGTGRNAGTTAHRAAWQAVYGPIAQGMTVDHTCKNRRCVNVSHMRLLSNFENARRTDGRDWPVGVCINGHDNEFMVEVSGKMTCKICAADWQRGYRARKAVR